MQVSDYIVYFLKSKGIKDVFGYPGGMVTYLMNSIDQEPTINQRLLYHEQGAAFAACGYSQSSGIPGVVYATSGPGATNLITGIGNAYFDSVPLICITGQVNTKESKVVDGIRQQGFQETDIVNIIKPITKYCVHVKDATRVHHELEKAYFNSINGRPGPVLIDIPIDIQRSEIEVGTIEKNSKEDHVNRNKYDSYCNLIINKLKVAKKPVIIAGNGINIANCKKDFLTFTQRLGLPVVTSMISVDLLDSDNPLNFGFIGAYGHRYANIITGASDLIISIGSRLDKRQTGTDLSVFAPSAEIIRIDIDDRELANNIKNDEVKLQIDISDFLGYFNNYRADFRKNNGWLSSCKTIKNLLNGIDDLLPNNYIKGISKLIPENSTITTDVGQNQVWVAQSFEIKKGQRILFSGGHGAMGYSLPAAIGAFVATKKPIYCFAGDGGFQMNIQELQTIVDYNMPIKIFIFNNKSLGMIKHFQEMYFESNFVMTDAGRGYGSPDFVKIAQAYGISSLRVTNVKDIDTMASKINKKGPILIEIDLPDMTYVYPKLVFGKPVQEQEPLLDKELLDKIMTIL